MRRSRAFVGFGGLLMAVTLSATSGQSQAADVSELSAEPAWRVPPLVSPMQLALPARAGSGRARPLGVLYFPSVAEWPHAHSDDRGSASVEGGVDRPCPPDMVEVEGEYCPLVEQTCLRWRDSTTMLQCLEFARAEAPGNCVRKPRHQRFCIDRYEWPNRVGALPRYMTSWNEAKASCESIGKRLCSDTEWTLACEGPERKPYPYGDGYARDGLACNIDKPYIWPNPERIYDPRSQSEELARLDQREPSGSRTTCVSPYGVHDMVGNVDEWVVNESQAGKPFRSGLKGGYWGPVRTRCRPMTTAHDESFRYYQIGYRCCGDSRLLYARQLPASATVAER